MRDLWWFTEDLACGDVRRESWQTSESKVGWKNSDSDKTCSVDELEERCEVFRDRRPSWLYGFIAFRNIFGQLSVTEL